MKKLTAQKCRDMIEDMSRDGFISTKEESYLQALQIAARVLEYEEYKEKASKESTSQSEFSNEAQQVESLSLAAQVVNDNPKFRRR